MPWLCLWLLALSAPAAVTILTEGFEGAFPGAWSTGDANASGTPAYWKDVTGSFGSGGSHSGGWKGYCAGNGFGGTSASPTYQNSMAAYMSQSFDLTGYTLAQLTFWHIIPGIEATFDWARIYVDADLVWSMNATVPAWSQVTVPLTAYAGGVHTLKFEFDSDGSTVFEGWYLDDILVTATLPPPNDNFASASPLSGTSGTVTGTSLGATKEVGEPNHAGNAGGASVWYRWTAPSSGTVTLSTTGSGFDTLLAVYTGSSVGALSLVTANDDTPPGTTSSATFIALAGTEYRIALDGYNGASGALTLSWLYPVVNETVLSTAVTNLSNFVIDSDASSGGAYNRDKFLILSSVASTNQSPLNHFTTYVLSYRLLDTNNQPHPIYDVTGLTNAGYTYNYTNSVLVGGLQSTTNLSTAGLRPAARLNPYNQYKVELKVYRLGVFTGATGSSSPNTYLHFTNLVSGDVAYNVIPFEIAPLLAQTYAIQTAPGKTAFLVNPRYGLYRYDDFALSSPVTNDVTVYVNYELHSTNGALIPLRNGSTNFVHPVPGYTAGTPNNVAVFVTFADTLQLEPVGQLDSVSNAYYVVVNLSCYNGPALPTVAAIPLATGPAQLLHFNGHLFFGTIDTLFTSINNLPAPGVVGPGYLSTLLGVDANSGSVVGDPAHTYGSGVALDVRLRSNGNAELNSGSVTLNSPSPDMGAVANVRFLRGSITLDSSGAHGDITAILPAGFGYRTNDISSKVIFSQIPFSAVPLTQALAPATDLSFTPGVPIFSCEETKPLWVESSTIVWRIAGGRFTAPTPPAVQYVRHVELAGLALASNLLVNPPVMALKRSNERIFDFANSISGNLDIRADARSNATMTATFNFVAGAFSAHFPYATEFDWAGAGSMKVVNDLVSGGLSSVLNGAAPVTVPYSANCPGCSSSATVSNTPAMIAGDGMFYFSTDGGLLASGPTVGTVDLKWGYITVPGAFAQQALGFQNAAVHMPGSFLRGDQNALAPDHGPASILYTGINATNLAQVERPLTSGYQDGFADYAGMNLRCVSDGAHNAISTIGGIPGINWKLTGRSKYYVRLAGVNGIHEAVPGTFPSTLYIYGYKFDFTQYGLSYLDSQVRESRTDGDVLIPYPSAHTQQFKELTFDCLGALQSAKVPSNDGPHKLQYWNADFFTLAIQFKRNDACVPGQGWLTLGVKAFATHVDQPLYGVLGFQTNGNLIPKSYGLKGVDSRLKGPNSMAISGPNNTPYNFTLTTDGYFNSYSNSPPSPGWMNFAGKLNVPFFEDMKIHLHTLCESNSPLNVHAALHLSGGWPRVGTTNGNFGWADGLGNNYFTTNYFDWDNLGYPGGAVTASQYENNPSSDQFHPRAQRLWLGIIEFDYPQLWDETLHTFKSRQEVTNDLLVIKVQHQVKYMDAKQAEIDFGAQYDGLPKISIANLAFNALDEATGVAHSIAQAAEQPIEQALSSGLDEFDQILDTQMKRLFDGVFDKTVDPLIHTFYQQLSNDWTSLKLSGQQTQFLATAVSLNLSNYFLGGVGGPVANNLSYILQSLSDGTNTANNLLGQLDTYLRDITNAIDAITGTISQTNGIDIGHSVQGLLAKDDNGQRNVAINLVKSLVGDFAAQFLNATVGPELSNLVAQVNPSLEEVATVLNDVKDALVQARAKLDPAAEFAKEMDDTLKSVTSKLTNVSIQVTIDVSNFFGKLDYSVDDPFQHFTEDQVHKFIRQQIEDAFFGSDPAAAVQVVLKQRLYDLDSQMRTSLDSVFQQLNQVMRDLISQSLAGLDDSINGLLGDVGDSIGAGKISGHALIDGDSLKLLRIDAHFQWKAPDAMEFDAYLQIKELTSDGSSGCYSSNAPATEVTIGAKNVSFEWFSPDLKANIETKFTFDGGKSFPVNFAGSLELIGELDYEAFQLYNLAAGLAFGKYENYLALRGGIKFNGYDFSGGIFFGRTCSLDPIRLLDPDVADMLGAPPFTGAYCYGQGWIPVSEAVLGIPASCLFEISAGVGAGAFYFAEGPTYGGKMFLGVQGEVLCLVSIEGDITMIGVKRGDDLQFKGTGHFEADIGPCPFCIKFSKSVSLQYLNHSWHID
jgi:hypothetical protein